MSARNIDLPLDTTHRDRDIWILKVPASLSDAVKGAETGAELGTMEVKTNPMGRLEGSVEVSKALIPKEEQEFTQRKFRLQTAPAIAGRALSIDERVVGPSASLQGNTTTSMVAMPDPRDPAYRAQRRRQRRQQEEARRQRKRTQLEPSITRPPSSTVVPLSEDSAAVVSDDVQLSVEAAVRATQEQYGRVTVPGLFEQRAYWTRLELERAFDGDRETVKRDLQRYCDFVRSGPRRQYYVLKPDLRTVRSAPLDEVEERK